MKALEGLKLVSFESRHAKTMGDLLRVQGAEVLIAPSMKEVPLEENKQVFEFAEKWFAGKIDVLVLLTGVGTRALATVLEAKYPKEAVLERFKKTVLVPRGPKPIRILNEWGVPFALTVPEPNTWKELLATIDQSAGKVVLKDKLVAVQEYGVENPELTEGLKKRGATVLRVPVYRWALPDDLKPLENAIHEILAGKIQVAVFTTAVQIEHLFQVAQKMGVEQKIKTAFQKTVVASVGPDCSEALKNKGLRVDIEPESPKMGPLALEIAAKAKAALSKIHG